MIELMRSIPVGVRQFIYGGFATVVFVIGGIQVWYASNGDVQPDWITNALNVAAYVGIGLGVTAAANAPEQDDGTPDGGYGIIEVIVGILVIIILVWVLLALLGNNK